MALIVLQRRTKSNKCHVLWRSCLHVSYMCDMPLSAVAVYWLHLLCRKILSQVLWLRSFECCVLSFCSIGMSVDKKNRNLYILLYRQRHFWQLLASEIYSHFNDNWNVILVMNTLMHMFVCEIEALNSEAVMNLQCLPVLRALLDEKRNWRKWYCDVGVLSMCAYNKCALITMQNINSCKCTHSCNRKQTLIPF